MVGLPLPGPPRSLFSQYNPTGEPGARSEQDEAEWVLLVRANANAIFPLFTSSGAYSLSIRTSDLGAEGFSFFHIFFLIITFIHHFCQFIVLTEILNAEVCVTQPLHTTHI